MLERPHSADIPTGPGVYIYTDARERVLYVGKARNLRSRVMSYFREASQLPIKTAAMMRHAKALQTLSTSTEKEALLLESTLIKRHKPTYNIVLRDDKQYVLFRIDHKQPFPRVDIVRQRKKDGARYFGPFTASGAARQSLKILHQLFPLRRCTNRAMQNRSRPCLYHHLGQCLAPCCLPVDKKLYAEFVNQATLFLSGKSKEVLDILQENMLKASANEDFEEAAKVRDTIFAIKRTIEKQAVVLHSTQKNMDMDVVGIAPLKSGLGLAILFVREGRLVDGRNFFWQGLELADAPDLVRHFLGQYYSTAPMVPPKILVPYLPHDEDNDESQENKGDKEEDKELEFEAQKIENIAHFSEENGAQAQSDEEGEKADDVLSLLESLLATYRDGPVRIALAQSLAETQLVDMACLNAREALPKKDENLSEQLGRLFAVSFPIKRIECVDVSHTGGTATRIGMVVFSDGKAEHSDFRTITLRLAVDEEGQGLAAGDDVGALAHWVERRLEWGPPWPDLLLVDGGRGQVQAVCRAFENAGIQLANSLPSLEKISAEIAKRPKKEEKTQEERDSKEEAENSKNASESMRGLFALAGMAKARDEQGRSDRRAGNVADRIFVPRRSNPLSLREGSPEMLFLQHIRNTAHSYALGKHRKARAKLALNSELQRLPGVGAATAKLLWQHFKSLQEMLAASEEDLAKIKGIGAKKAKLLRERLKSLET